MINVIIVPYQDTFQWSLALEYALSLRENRKDVMIISCELIEIRNIKRLIASRLGYSYLNKEVISYARSCGVEILSVSALVKKSPPSKIFNDDGTLNFSDNFVKIAAATVGDSLRTGTLVENKRTIATFDRQIGSAKTLNRLLDEIALRFNGLEFEVFTINGRYTLNKTIKEFFRSQKIPTLMLEYGKGLSYTIWNNAQSMAEVESKSIQLWSEAPADKRMQIAADHMNARLLSGKGNNAAFTRNMEKGRLPEFPESKKICIFYSTSKIEFLFLDDHIPMNNYQNQQQALRDLILILGAEWHIYIRRHPYGNNNKFGDDEGSQWDEFRRFENLTIIEPDEPVDSYELARHADLVAHFGSSIGADLIFMNSCPVVSLGPTEWEFAQPSSKARNLSELKRYLAADFVREDPLGILPWAYFYETRGEPFRYICRNDEGQILFESIQLTISIREWLFSLPARLASKLKERPKEVRS